MKKTLSFFFLLIFTFSSLFNSVYSEDLSTAEFSWDANSYENVTKLEFILNLDWSVLEQWINADKNRISYKWTDEWWKIKVLSILNVSSYEEKLVLRLTWESNQYVDFVNFDTDWNIKKFHNISLIEQNWKIKAKITIYVNENIDSYVYEILKNWVKSAKYLYFWMKSWKPYKKAKTIKVN